MSFWTLIVRSLRFHARAHLGALLASIVGSAVLIGALVVGDSVRGSLREMALSRLGGTEVALVSNDRLFRADLANEIAADLNGGSATGANVITAAVLQLPGTAATGDGSARANRVQVLGVDSSFWKLANEAPAFANIPADATVINRTLAEQLAVKKGDSIVLRIQKPSQLSRDAPLSPDEDVSVALRVSVSDIVSDDQFGWFSLQANQVPPFSAFVSLPQLQKRVEITNQANLLLAGPKTTSDSPETFLTAAAKSLSAHWNLADAQAELRRTNDNALELRSSRVFLDAPLAEAALKASPDARGILTYFVNELRIGTNATPYSMVTAGGDPLIPAGMRDDEIILNQWLADDLGAKAGDELETSFYVVGTMRKLEERRAKFRVRAIVPMSAPWADSSLMPDFPGLTDADNCRDWDTGFPIQTDKIRDKDEKYWDDHRGTPKAFVTLAAGQALWGNRFGNMTSVRYPATEQPEKIASAIHQNLEPAAVGLSFQPVRAQALAASAQAQDFGQLFLGFSFFLITAALLLVALMYQFGIEQRAKEIGTLLSLGLTPKQVRRLLLWEGGALVAIGSIIGVPGGIWYAQAMLHGLSTIWRSAVGTSSLQYHAQPGTLVIGVVASILVAWLAIWLTVRKQAGQPARQLLAEGADADLQLSSIAANRPSWSLLIGGGSTLGALALVAWAVFSGNTTAAGLFFGAGALLLIGGAAFCSALLTFMGIHESEVPTLSGLGVRNATRRRRRSLAILTLLACGSFLIASIGVFRLESEENANKRSSGTGGFALIGEATIPVTHDLNASEGRDFFTLNARELTNVAVVPLRMREGDDASCLNLNRAQKPRLLGVNPQLLAERDAFSFAKTADGIDAKNPWLALNETLPDDAVPAIGDAASIQWALGKKVGDTLDYTDEQGRTFKLRLVGAVANSILQGNLLISENQFIRRFPSESGYRMFLIDAPSNRLEAVSAELSRGLRDVGLEITPATRRLAAFNAVQNTYLSTFQVLGGLGLLLGSIGLGVVVLRNVLERRGELALLSAVGFQSRSLKWLVVSEHGGLLLLGLMVGIVASLVAVLPTLLAPGREVPYVSVVLTLAAVLLSGALWTWLAAAVALRGKLLDSLRNN